MTQFRLQVLCYGLFFLKVAFFSRGSALKPDGVNVCSKNQRYTTVTTNSRIVTLKVKYKTPCSGGFWLQLNCTRYRMVNQVQYFKQSVTRYKIVYGCCNGWKAKLEECSTAICSKYGCIKGNCTEPDVCNCTKGYYGPSCNRECPSHKYGAHCFHDCKCMNNATCDSKEGTCDCLEGWTGIYCNESCSRGTFGRNCSKKCNCEKSNMNMDCEHKNGECMCKPGYIGSRCQYPCINNTYGLGCMYKCSCTPNEICAIDTGKCICSVGYRGKHCEQRCENGTTGYNCSIACNCTRNQGKCNNFTGKCSCLTGFNGTHCEYRCSQNMFGPYCPDEEGSAHSQAGTVELALIFLPVVSFLVIILVAVLIIILIRKRRRGGSPKTTPKLPTSRKISALRNPKLQHPDDKNFCADDLPYEIPMTISNDDNISDANQCVIPDNQQEIYSNAEEPFQKENINDYENVEAMKTVSSQKIFEDDPSNTYQELCRQPYEECSYYQSLQK